MNPYLFTRLAVPVVTALSVGFMVDSIWWVLAAGPVGYFLTVVIQHNIPKEKHEKVTLWYIYERGHKPSFHHFERGHVASQEPSVGPSGDIIWIRKYGLRDPDSGQFIVFPSTKN